MQVQSFLVIGLVNLNVRLHVYICRLLCNLDFALTVDGCK
uniref:Uncharacterized protein n=1 Tax=Anguilla anguilla TaxID=7936 RepID=A0A0E9SVU6_ANGAN